MLEVKRISAVALSLAIAIWAAGCSDRHPSAPEDESSIPEDTSSTPEDINADLPAGIVVSNALASSGTTSSLGVSGSLGARTTLGAVAGTRAYLSAAPKTFAGSIGAALSNNTTGAVSQHIWLIDGGFDPVGIDAKAGDELLLIVFRGGDALTPVAIKVPPRRPPVIVRTNPAKGRVDVALNVQLVVVFSEPIDRSSVTSSSLSLLRNGTAVSGSVRVSADGLSAEFIPDNPLEAETSYSLVIASPIKDLDGDPLEESSIVSFTTAKPATNAAQVVFSNLIDGQIYRVGIDGTGLTRLTGSGFNNRPVFSPDGRHIAFASGPINGAVSDIYIMDADGSNVVRRTRSGHGASAAWSPDGRKLAISDEGVYYAEMELISADEDGSTPIRLATDARTAAWSPDGQQIAFVATSGDDGYHHIRVMQADGSMNRPLTEIDPAGIYGLAWSPDGLRIALSKCISGGCDIHVMNADGSGLTRITTVGNTQGAAWSPDGAWIAFTLSRYSGSEWLPTVAYVPSSGGAPIVVGDGYWPSWRY